MPSLHALLIQSKIIVFLKSSTLDITSNHISTISPNQTCIIHISSPSPNITLTHLIMHTSSHNQSRLSHRLMYMLSSRLTLYACGTNI